MRPTSTHSLLRAALLAALLVATSAPAPRSLAQTTTVTTNETIPFSGTITNQCNGDSVTFSGSLHMTNHVSTDSSGGTHIRSHVNYQSISGTGTPSGLNYQITGKSNETLNEKEGSSSTMTIVQTVNVISQGSAPNSVLRSVFHVTINSNGTTSSVVDNARVECRG